MIFSDMESKGKPIREAGINQRNRCEHYTLLRGVTLSHLSTQSITMFQNSGICALVSEYYFNLGVPQGSTHIGRFRNKAVLSIWTPRIFTEPTVVPKVDDRLADGMCAGELNIHPVPLDFEYLRLGKICNRQYVVNWWSVDEVEGLLVCVSKEEDEGGQHVPQRRCSWWHIFKGFLWVKWYTIVRGLSRAGTRQKSLVDGRGEDCRVGYIERDHGLLYRSVEYDLSRLG